MNELSRRWKKTNKRCGEAVCDTFRQSRQNHTRSGRPRVILCWSTSLPDSHDINEDAKTWHKPFMEDSQLKDGARVDEKFINFRNETFLREWGYSWRCIFPNVSEVEDLEWPWRQVCSVECESEHSWRVRNSAVVPELCCSDSEKGVVIVASVWVPCQD